ncbi:hypothetical protein HZC09_01085 [Candidatus Micrarchaeota archaeon]|nr:hypothetical protein [Candidatus Micrarchaeota archaeon]
MSYAKLLRNYKILLLIGLLLVSFYLVFLKDLNPATVDLNLGIEFAGGVRIPISLEKNVDQQTMDSIIDTLKQRINKFGLSQAQVRPLGSKEILVELPMAQPQVIKTVETLLREQGRFEAIVSRKVALNSSHRTRRNALRRSGFGQSRRKRHDVP